MMKKVLIVNKFLYPNGGSETYIFEIGKQLQKMGCEVQYFGMYSDKNVVGNTADSYTKNMDFHTGKLQKLLYPFKILYSFEARKAIRKVMEQFEPDVVHLNNFNFQLTPSIIDEVRAFEKKTGKKIKILYTAHDYQLVCPNHMMRSAKTETNCEKCMNGSYVHCTKGRCIHGSAVKSLLGSIEGYLYKWRKTYYQIDTIICPSAFIKDKLDHNPALKGKTVVMHNFSTVSSSQEPVQKEDYVLYFGRYAKEKGVETLLNVCAQLPQIPFIFAGSGPLEESVDKAANVTNRGFLRGQELAELIGRARFSIYPSEWYENCPFSVMESIQYGTPVLGAKIGGIPELIDDGATGKLFESGNQDELRQKIAEMWENCKQTSEMQKNCLKKEFVSVELYCQELEANYF